MMIGNHSKDAKSWLNGPTHEIRNQCLPGYTGFIPGIKAENVFSTTYAANTAKSFAQKIPRGVEGSLEERFKTLQSEKFSPLSNRRIIENDQFASRRDYLEYTIAVNNLHRDQREQFLRDSPREKETNNLTTISPVRFKKDMNGSLYSHVKDI